MTFINILNKNRRPRFTVNIDGTTEEVDLTEKMLMIDEMVDLNSTDISTNATKLSTHDAQLDLKADQGTTYTKTQVDNKLDLKANLDDLEALSTDVDNKLGGKVDTNHLTANYQ